MHRSFLKLENLKDINEIFKYIKILKLDTINAFESYSKIYSSVIELDKN